MLSRSDRISNRSVEMFKGLRVDRCRTVKTGAKNR
ncbi:hypothetical protein LINPERHAP1_LOCUS16179, partial [Linum perenne]